MRIIWKWVVVCSPVFMLSLNLAGKIEAVRKREVIEARLKIRRLGNVLW